MRRVTRTNGTPITTTERHINVAIEMNMSAVFLKGGDAVELFRNLELALPIVVMNTTRRPTGDVTSLQGGATTLGAERFIFVRDRGVYERLGLIIYRGTALL